MDKKRQVPEQIDWAKVRQTKEYLDEVRSILLSQLGIKFVNEILEKVLSLNSAKLYCEEKGIIFDALIKKADEPYLFVQEFDTEES